MRFLKTAGESLRLSSALAIGLLGTALSADAQTTPSAPPATVAPPATPREAELEARVRQLESLVNRLSTQVETLATSARPPAPGAPTPAPAPVPASILSDPAAGPPSRPDDRIFGGSAGPSPLTPPRSAGVFNMPAPTPSIPLPGVKFGPGFEIKSADEEYSLQFHNLTQFDYRGYQQGGQDPVHDTFAIPRQWFIFSGRLTKPYEYYVSMAEGFDNLNILDVFLNVHYDDRLQFKIGRYKTPYTYEFYALPINGLITPERSLFFNNFGLNRDLGLMAWGQLFDKRMDYAAGIFNGTRNGFLDANDSKDLAAFLNFKPFLTAGIPALENFNFGGSMDTGNQFNVPIPATFRTNVATSGNLINGPQFLAFNNNVRESGWRAFWALHAAYYYRQLSVIAEWQAGFQDYALASTPRTRTMLPVNSFYAQAGYFLTGETVSMRGPVRPNRPFDLRRGKLGPGAWELAARYSSLDYGDQVFTAGLADPNNWTNRVWLTDLGVNWYWTQYLKVWMGWEHVEFGDPVLFASGRRQTTSDMGWLRFQIYF